MQFPQTMTTEPDTVEVAPVIEAELSNQAFDLCLSIERWASLAGSVPNDDPGLRNLHNEVVSEAKVLRTLLDRFLDREGKTGP